MLFRSTLAYSHEMRGSETLKLICRSSSSMFPPICTSVVRCVLRYELNSSTKRMNINTAPTRERPPPARVPSVRSFGIFR
jgi:hypothetical protein